MLVYVSRERIYKGLYEVARLKMRPQLSLLWWYQLITVCKVRTLSDDEPADVLARGQKRWKLALYWVTDTRLFTLSPSLKPPDNTNDLPHVPCYRYVGTARLGEFPGYVRERAKVLARLTGASDNHGFERSL